jgi:hypothetical protein
VLSSVHDSLMDLQIQNSAPLDYGDIVPPEPKVEDHTVQLSLYKP